MKVILRNPRREVEVEGAAKVGQLLKELNIVPEAVLVVRDGELLLRQDVVQESDVIELRPVISGGSR